MSIPSLFAGKGIQEALCVAVLSPLRKRYKFSAESKKTLVQLAAASSVFLEIHPRRDGLRLNIVLGRALESPRIAKTENVSKSRFHNELELTALDEVDEELLGWIGEAYARSAAA
jgi:hypothetical protein